MSTITPRLDHRTEAAVALLVKHIGPRLDHEIEVRFINMEPDAGQVKDFVESLISEAIEHALRLDENGEGLGARGNTELAFVATSVREFDACDNGESLRQATLTRLVDLIGRSCER